MLDARIPIPVFLLSACLLLVFSFFFPFFSFAVEAKKKFQDSAIAQKAASFFKGLSSILSIRYRYKK